MPDGENNRGVTFYVELIQSDVTSAPARNEQFPVAMFRRPADERVILEDFQAAGQYICRDACAYWIRFHQELRQAFDVMQRRRRKYEPRHGKVYSFTALGRLARLPLSLSCR